MSNFVEPTPKEVAELLIWSNVGGNHEGNGWDVQVKQYGRSVEMVVTPYDRDTGDEAPGYKRAFRLVVEEMPLAEAEKWAGRS